MTISDEDAQTDTGGRSPIANVQRVRTASEQVYDQLRNLIMSGELARGERLPSEIALARDFGVSRGTAREALRVLAAEQLIRRSKGASGGSFVTLPTPDFISDFLRSNISLLSEADDVSPDDLLEVRELLEAFAARRAAQRRVPEDIEILRACIVDDPALIGTDHQFERDDRFHDHLVNTVGNTVLCIAAQPVFGVVQQNFRRRELSVEALTRVNDEHKQILAAVEAGDPQAAEDAMRAHLATLRGFYHRLWRTDSAPPSAISDANHGPE